MLHTSHTLDEDREVKRRVPCRVIFACDYIMEF